MATELGAAYLSILPDLSKLGGLVSKGMTSAGAAGAKAFSGAAKKGLGGLAKAFGETGKDAGEALAKQALAAAKSDLAKLSKQMASATDAQATALGRLRVAQAKLDEVRADSKAKASQVAAAEEALATAQRKANVATTAAKGLTEKLASAQDKAKNAADAVAKAQADAAAQAAKAGGGAGNKFTQAFKSGFRPQEAASALNKIDGKREGKALATRFGVGFNGAFGGIISKSAVLLAATFATVGIGGLVSDSVNLEATFSQTMNTMAAVAKVPASGIKSLSDLALQMGADTTFSASEAAGAMLELAKGGLSAATIQSGALQGTLTLAAAGGTDLATASTIASNALNTFGLKGKDMASVAAALAGGANASSASVESLGEALGQVGPGATNAGLSLQDTVGVLSAFDAAGIKGSDAGTSLKTMLTRLVPQTKLARDAMSDLGLKFTDAQGSFLPITNIAEQLRTKLSSLSEEQRTTALSTIFGSDATRAATVLMKDGAAGIGSYIKATKDQNAANEVAAARMSGTAGAIEQFKGSVETAKLQLGQFLAPAVQAGLGKLTQGVNGLAPAFQGVVSILGKGDFTKQFRDAFHVEEDSPVVAFLLNLRTVVGKVFTEIRGSLFAFSSGFHNFEDGFTTGGISGFFERLGITAGQVFSGLKNNVLPVLVSFAKNLTTDLLPPVIAIASKLGDLAGTLVSAVGPAFLSITGFIKDNTTTFQALAVGVGVVLLGLKAYQLALVATRAIGVAFAVVQRTIAASIILYQNGLKAAAAESKIFAAVQAVVNAVMSANPIALVVIGLVALAAGLVYAYKHSETFRDIVNGVFGAVKGVVLTVVGAIKVAIGALVTAFFAVKGAISTAIGAVVSAFDAVKGAVSKAIGFVTDHWKLIAGIIGGPFVAIVLLVTTYWGQIKAGFMAGINAVVGALKTAWGAIVGVFSGPVNAVINVLGAIWSRIYPILVLPFFIANAAITKIWSLIQAGFTAAVGFVQGAFAAAWNLVQQTIIAPLDRAWHGVVFVWSLIQAGFTAAKDWVITTFAKAWAAVSGVLSGPINTAKTWIGQRFTDIRNAFTAAKDWVVNSFSKAWSAVTGVLSKAVADGKTAISTVFGKIQGAFTSAKDWVVNTFSKAWNGIKEKLTKPISDAKDAIGHLLSNEKAGLQVIFSKAVTAIGKIWDGLQALAKAPIKFIVNTVLNDGLISAFNWVAGKFQAPTIEPIPLPKGFEAGGQFDGRLPGRPSAVDNMLGMTSKGAVGLATGEFITNSHDTARALPLLEHINSGGDLPGFASGGLFGKLKDGISGAFSAGKSLGQDVLGFLGDPVKWFKDRMAGPLGRLSELGDSPIAQVVKSVPRKLVDTVSGKAKDLLTGLVGGGGPINPGLSGALNWARSQVGKPYIWGGVGPDGYDCSGFMSAIVNEIRGNNPFQRLFATGSLPAGMFAPGPGAFELGWFTGNPGHVAGTLNGTNVESRGGRGVVVGPEARGAHDVLFNQHGHLIGFAGGGIIGDAPFDELDPRGKAFKGKAILPRSALSFDSGGLLPTGTSVVHNGTGTPEPVGHDFLRKSDLDGMKFVLDVPSVGTLTGHIDARAAKVQTATATRLVHEFDVDARGL